MNNFERYLQVQRAQLDVVEDCMKSIVTEEEEEDDEENAKYYWDAQHGLI